MNILCKQVTDHCSGIHIILRKPNVQFKLKRLLYIDKVQQTQCKKLSKVIKLQCTNFNFFPKNWLFLLVFKVNENIVRLLSQVYKLPQKRWKLLYCTTHGTQKDLSDSKTMRGRGTCLKDDNQALLNSIYKGTLKV